MSLHNGSMSVTIHYKPRQMVTLTMDQSKGVVFGIVCNAYSLPYCQGTRDAFFPEFIGNVNIFKRKNAYRNRAYLIMSNCDELAVFVYDTDELSLLNTIVHMMNGS